MSELEEGDVVELKSGGPKMTALHREYMNEGAWICSWFVDGEEKRNTFQEKALKKVECNEDD